MAESKKITAIESNELLRSYPKEPTKSIWQERVLHRFAAELYAKAELLEDVFPMISLPLSALGVESGAQYIRIKKLCDSISSSSYSFLDATGKRVWLPLYSRIEYQDGVISVRFNNEMRPYLTALSKNFSTIDYNSFCLLKTIPGQRLYDFLRSWHGCDITPPVSLEDLHRALEAKPYERKQFKVFKQRTLQPALDDVRNAGVWVEPSYTREGRSHAVVAISFYLNPIVWQKQIKMQQEQKEQAQSLSRQKVLREMVACRCSCRQPDGVILCSPRPRTKKCALCMSFYDDMVSSDGKKNDYAKMSKDELIRLIEKMAASK